MLLMQIEKERILLILLSNQQYDLQIIPSRQKQSEKQYVGRTKNRAVYKYKLPLVLLILRFTKVNMPRQTTVSPILNRRRYKNLPKKVCPIFRQCLKHFRKQIGIKWQQYRMTQDWCPYFVQRMINGEVTSIKEYQFMFQDCSSIDQFIPSLSKDKCHQKFHQYFDKVLEYLTDKQNRLMIPLERWMVRQILKISLPVFAIAMTFICLKQQMLIPQNYVKLNTLFKEILGGFKIEDHIGKDPQKLNIQLLCNTILNQRINQSQLQIMEEQNTRKNQIVYERKYYQKRKNNVSGPFVFKNALESENIEDIIDYLTKFKEVITDLASNASTSNLNKKRGKYNKNRNRNINEEFNVMPQNQLNLQDILELFQREDKNQNAISQNFSGLPPLSPYLKSLLSSKKVLSNKMQIELNKLQDHDNYEHPEIDYRDLPIFWY